MDTLHTHNYKKKTIPDLVDACRKFLQDCKPLELARNFHQD